MYRMLKWVEALNDGYGEREEIQPATSPNLTAFFIEEGVLEDKLEDKFTRRAIRRREDEVREYVVANVGMQLRNLYGKQMLNKWEDAVMKTKENHLYLDKGITKRKMRVSKYTLTKKGKQDMQLFRTRFDKIRDECEEKGISVPQDTIKIPNDTRWGWRLEEYSVPRIHRGTAIDSGVDVPVPHHCAD